MPPGKTPAVHSQGSKSAKAAPGASRTLAGKAKVGAAPRRIATPSQRKSTPGGLLAIAILGGLAIGVVAMVMYSVLGPKSPWAFDRPEAQLPSLQSKHTLQ